MPKKKYTPSQVALKIVVIIAMLIIFTCFVSLGEDIMYNKIYQVDTAMYDFALSIRTPFLTFVFKVITNLCNPFVIGAIALVLLFVLINKDKKAYSFALFLNLGLTALLNLSLKYIFARERPDISQRLVSEPGYSFPSGHAMFAVAFYGFIIYLIFKSETIKKATKALSLITISLGILLICFSRIYLGVHYFSDVLGGIMITTVYLVIFTYILDRNRIMYNKPATDYKKHSFLGGFKYALRGIYASITDENNMLVQFSAGMMVIMFAVFLRCTFVEWAILIIMCFLVVALEMVNTAIENVCDKITLEYDEKIKKAKDISAGAVLTMSICAIIVAAVIFIPKIPVLFPIIESI